MFKSTYLILLISLFILALPNTTVYQKKLAPATDNHAALLRGSVGYLNTLLAAYAGKGCVLKMPPQPKVFYVDEMGLWKHCGPFALGCYHTFRHEIYVLENDFHTLNHEYVHSILAFNHLPRTCWEHMAILQMDSIIKRHIDDYAKKHGKSRASEPRRCLDSEGRQVDPLSQNGCTN